MTTNPVDLESLRGHAQVVRITAEGTREVAAQCSRSMRADMHLRASELDSAANDIEAVLAELTERRARDAKVAELVEAASVFTIDCRGLAAWHPAYRPMLDRLKVALAAFKEPTP